jgi:hypothetical protein
MGNFTKEDFQRGSLRTPSKGRIYSHANMPNVRIAVIYSSRETVLSIHASDQVHAPCAAGNEMNDTPTESVPAAIEPEPAPKKILSPAAQRALAEAEARRAAAEANTAKLAKEFQGPDGPEPTRFGDWERKGIASDF